jgi:hypothetical protein
MDTAVLFPMLLAKEAGELLNRNGQTVKRSRSWPYLAQVLHLSGRLVMVIAPRHLRTQIPQPMQRLCIGRSTNYGLAAGAPGGQKYSHSLEHLRGWQRSRLMMAILMGIPQLRRSVQVTSQKSTTMNST